MDLELYGDDGEVARLEALLPAVPKAIVPLAWHLRQRDTTRALALADMAAAQLGDAAEAGGDRTRLTLLRAEAAWLRGEMAAAEQLQAAARNGFRALGDPIGEGDAALLDSRIANDLGDAGRQRRSLEESVALYAGSGDGRRHAAALAWAYFDSQLQGVPDRAALDTLLLTDARLGTGDVDALITLATATEEFRFGRYATAEAKFGQASDLLLRVGLVRHAIYALATAAIALSNLNQVDRAVLLAERILELARPTGWPYCIGTGLRVLGITDAVLGRHEAAKAALLEALDWLAPLRRSSVYMVTAFRLAGACRDLGQFDEALATLEQARAAALEAGHVRLMPDILAGMARTLSELGRAGEALILAEEALDRGRTIAHAAHANALEALIEVHLRAKLPPPPGMVAANPALHYLDLLRAVADEGRDWVPEPRFLANCARACEQAGDLAKALDFERRSRAAGERESARKASERLAEMRLRHEAETARREAAQQRRLAAAEAARAAIADAASRTLDELGRIGQELTATLDAETVFKALTGRVGALLDVQSLSIWLLDDSGGTLVETFGVEDGVARSGYRVALDDPAAVTARAVREQAEILLQPPAGISAVPIVPGTRPMQSALFGPLIVGERVLGVLSIQSDRDQAYGERECLIFRTLCAYSAIALDNARAYLSLNHANAELERLANLDPLTGLANRRCFFAGVATELALARRHGLPCAVVMIDLDHFKRVNDSHGHAAGDATLRSAADCLRLCLRESDLGARFGGEELAAFLPGTDLDGAVQFAERFRRQLEATETVHEAARIRVTASVGVSDWGAQETGIEAAIARADAALYRVKQSGRNGVAAEPAPGP